jgi:hypothetical protein
VQTSVPGQLGHLAGVMQQREAIDQHLDEVVEGRPIVLDLVPMRRRRDPDGGLKRPTAASSDIGRTVTIRAQGLAGR